MRQVNAVNGSQMVVKTGVVYYRAVKGKGVEIDWDLYNPMFYILCLGKSIKCISCFTEQCVKIDVILKTVDYDKNVSCRVCDHRLCGIRHGRPEDSIIICQKPCMRHDCPLFQGSRSTLFLQCCFSHVAKLQYSYNPKNDHPAKISISKTTIKQAKNQEFRSKKCR